MFKVNKKDTRTPSGVFIVNFEHISHLLDPLGLKAGAQKSFIGYPDHILAKKKLCSGVDFQYCNKKELKKPERKKNQRNYLWYYKVLYHIW